MNQSIINLANLYPNLRYPKISLNVFSAHNNIENSGLIRLETFVSNKNRIAYVIKTHNFSSDLDVFEIIEIIKKDFNIDCNNMQKNYIFNKYNSIKEPFETNK